MSDPQLDALRDESAAVRIGALWLAEIRDACADVSRRFNPDVYAVVEGLWSEGELDDLAQDVTVEQLLRQGQLDYILDIAEGISDVHRLLRHQVRRALTRRRRRTVVDRLITRLSSLLNDNYERIPGVTPVRYRPRNSDLSPEQPRDEQLRRATAAVRLLPTSAASGDRAPTVFRTDVLGQVAAIAFRETGTSLSLADFDRILNDALTSWVPVVLELDDNLEVGAPGDYDLGLEQTVMMISDELDAADRLVLRTKLSGAPDSELASLLGVSRPTAAKRKAEAFTALRASWQRHAVDVDADAQYQLAQLLYLRLQEVVSDE